nr:AIPR family protein [uncultured Sphingomonas sp.]
MIVNDLNYGSLKKLIARYQGKGRSESATFLNWFLENIYRLNDVEADDAICDQSNDKGIDGLYVDNSTQEIHLFQAKITQKDGRTIGDSDLKNFVGSIEQFRTPASIDLILAGNANQDLKRILTRQNIKALLESGYRVRGIFVTNQDPDGNSEEYLKHHPELVIYDRANIALEYVDFDADEGVKATFDFDVSYAGYLEMAGDEGIKIFMLPVQASELVKLSGIVDTTLFKQNVRLTLGNTAVNKSIEKSILDAQEHRKFPLYHNGITILCQEAAVISDSVLRISDYVVVNGAQSITTFFKNAKSLSEDLRVFAKVIALRDEQLARKITINSNNQNAIKARDLRSNHNIMLRLKAEFEAFEPTYDFEIKRGEEASAGKTSITNEAAGRLLLAFDLDEPHSCHQIYKVFDEKYAEIFGRPEVTASRIVFIHELFEVIDSRMVELNPRADARICTNEVFHS